MKLWTEVYIFIVRQSYNIMNNSHEDTVIVSQSKPKKGLVESIVA